MKKWKRIKLLVTVCVLLAACIHVYGVADSGIEAEKRGAIECIASGNGAGAETAISRMVSRFAGSDKLADSLNQVAHAYRAASNEEAARQIYSYVVENLGEDEHAMWAQMGVVRSTIALNEAVDSEIEKLKARFAGHKFLAKALHDTAHDYRDLGMYAEAEALHRYVVENLNDARGLIWAQAAIAMCNVALGNDGAAQAATDKLVREFGGHRGLAECLILIGEEYYKEAMRDIREGRQARAMARLERAVGVWGIILDGMAENKYTLEALRFSARSYQLLGRHEKAIECHEAILVKYRDSECAWVSLVKIGANYQDMAKAGLLSKTEADQGTETVYRELLEFYPGCKGSAAATNWLERNNSK